MNYTFYVVWNEFADKCDFPTRKHDTFEGAEKEAKRLATGNPGVKFTILKAMLNYEIAAVKVTKLED
jgi:hypothetical protein